MQLSGKCEWDINSCQTLNVDWKGKRAKWKYSSDNAVEVNQLTGKLVIILILSLLFIKFEILKLKHILDL